MKIETNPHLTNEACDAILDRLHHDIYLDDQRGNITWRMYRKSQYENIAAAVNAGATRYGQCSGLMEAELAFQMLEQMADMMDHDSHHTDVRVIASVDETPLRECCLSDALHEIRRHFVRLGWYTVE